MSWNPPPPPPGSTPPANEGSSLGNRHRPSSHDRRPSRRGGKRWVILFVLVLVVAAVWLGWRFWSQGSRPTVEQGTWLDVSFNASYPDERPERRGLGALFTPPPLSHQDLLTALRRAEVDPRITGVLLHPDLYAGGWAQAQELRKILAELRAKGKAVWAYLELSRSGAYFLATAADSIAIAPEGNLLVLGLQARMSYYKRTLDKLGVRADFVAIGEYKSAPESWTQEGPSDPARRQIEVFVDQVYDHWLSELALARGFSTDHMADLVDQGYFDSEEALDEGLVDRVLEERKLREKLAPKKGTGGDTDLATIDPLEYLQASWKPSPPVDRKQRIAVIYATGQIVPGTERPGSGFMGSQTLAARLLRAREDQKVKAVVLRVDSPGGSTLASDTIWRSIEDLRAKKPLVVSMSNMAASGGYYISMSADRIIAEPLTLTGSIGVFVGKADLSGLYDKLGMNHELISRGENAGLFSELQSFTPDQRETIHRQLERFYERFVDRVAEGRGMSFSQADSIARGRVWSGSDGKKLGLVDEIGGLQEAIASAKELGGIPIGVRPEIVTYQKTPSALDRYLRRFFWDAGVEMSLPQMALRISVWMQERALAAAMDGSQQFRLPFDLKVE